MLIVGFSTFPNVHGTRGQSLHPSLCSRDKGHAISSFRSIKRRCYSEWVIHCNRWWIRYHGEWASEWLVFKDYPEPERIRFNSPLYTKGPFKWKETQLRSKVLKSCARMSCGTLTNTFLLLLTILDRLNLPREHTERTSRNLSIAVSSESSDRSQSST